MVTMETADNALKSFYLDAVKEALDYKINPFLAKIQKTSADVVGKDVKRLVRTTMNGGVGAGSETGALPAAESSDKVVLTSTLKNIYGTIEISDKAIRASASDEGAFVNLLNDEMQSLIKSAKTQFGRMLFGDGTGFLTTAWSIDTDGALVVDEYHFITPGMKIQVFVNGVEVEALRGRKVLSVDPEHYKVYLDGGSLEGVIEMGEEHKLYVYGAQGYELTGLAALFNSDTIYGLKKTENPALMPYIKKDVGQITDQKMQMMVDRIEERSGSKVNLIICSWGVRRALMQYYSEQSMPLPSIQLEDGTNALSFNGIPVVVDRFCPPNTMYFLNTDDFKLHQLCDWKWLEGEDGKVLKQVPGKPVYTATLVKYAELMCDRPNGQGVLEDLSEV